MAKKKSTTRDECVASFEESLEELEKIVAELESGKLGLSDALARYEEGVKHLKGCQQLLEMAERKIELLSGVDADGNPIAEPFEEGEVESLEAKAAARAGRRTSVSKSTSVKISMRGDDVDEVPRLF
ncbi:MAG TPA: exodeoxyribonuclease VII small subunit [Lacipirellulaceae bacterium]|nr:exodeoxyribonuclease VII small subunit [Lacipirellulaceae bacterium]